MRRRDGQKTAPSTMASESFSPVWHHRMKYFLSPQLDLYKNIARKFPKRYATLDYGCGTGFGTLQLYDPKSHVFGVDVDKNAIQFAKDIISLPMFECVDFLSSSPKEGFNALNMTFDLISCIEVIEHCSDPHTLLFRLKNILWSVGTIVVSTKNQNSGYRKNEAHETEYTIDAFKDLIHSTLGEGARFADFTLENDLEPYVTPMVAIWQKP